MSGSGTQPFLGVCAISKKNLTPSADSEFYSRSVIENRYLLQTANLFPNGNNNEVMTSSENLGQRIRKRRKEIGLNQADLELASGTGVRFVSDLENGKETCQLGKFLTVAANLGFELDLKLKG